MSSYAYDSTTDTLTLVSGNAYYNIIAPIEKTSTAAVEHSEGSQLIYGSLLYDVTSAISIGDTLVVYPAAGYNIKLSDKLTEKIDTINSNLSNEISTRAKLGGHNLLPNNIISGTYLGALYTVNADKSVTISQSTTENVAVSLVSDFELEAGNYILSGGIDTNCVVDIKVDNNYYSSSGNDVPFTVGDNSIIEFVRLTIYGARTVSGTFYPMIRLATDTNSDYQPYSMTNQELTPIAQAVSNRNLLDNPWFTVNQRGETSIPSGNYKYWMDRWKTGNGGSTATGMTVTLESDGIHISASGSVHDVSILEQVLPADAITDYNAPYTISLLLANRKVESYTFNVSTPTSSWQRFVWKDLPCGLRLSFTNETSGAWQISLAPYNTNAVVLRAIKLEKGSVSTLAQDTVPNYATELLKCQRYFVRLAPNSSDQYGVIGQGIMYSDTLAWIPLNMPVAMRAKPSISYNLDSGKIKITGKGLTAASGKAVTAISVNDRQPMQLLYFNCASQSNLSAGDAVLIWFVGTTDAYIDLSADL